MTRKQLVLRILAGVAALAGLLLLYTLLAPSPIDAAAYEPAPGRPLTGVLTPDEALRSTVLLAQGRVRGPEDVAVDAAGRIYGGQENGRIVRVTSTPTVSGPEVVETFADTGGRPLGLAWDAAGNLLVADAVRGLLSVNPDGELTDLTSEADGEPYGFTDDVDVAPDGTVYFSDASSEYGVHEYLYDLMEARPHGRLLAFDPVTAVTTVLLDDLYFANGVAVSPDGEFVLVNETYRYRIRRLWLRGPKAGTSEIFIDRLPGFPDGISTRPAMGTASDGRVTFWVAMFTVRNPLMEDFFHPRPWWKERLALLPRILWPRPEPYGLVLGLDRDGEIVEALHDPGGRQVRTITSVEEVDGALYLGNLHGDWIGRWTPP